MASKTIATIQDLARRFRSDERNLTLYFPDFETPPDPTSYNRVFGPPVGLTDAQWPTFPELAELLQQTNSLRHWDPSDHRMEHVFTIELRDVDLLGVPADAVAMMLFISNASFHRACRDGNPHTTVRFLTKEDLRRGVYQGSLPQRSLYRWSRRFSLVAVDVPGDVFDVPELDLPADDLLAQLYDAVAEAPARLGGCPIGLHEDEEWPISDDGLTRVSDGSLTIPYLPDSSLTIPYDPDRRSPLRADRLLEQGRAFDDGDPASALTFGHRTMSPSSRTSGAFLMQFQRRFAEVDLGQRGVMYVSGQSAYMQAH